jgi:mortality factor 4-like protein 1
MCPSLPSDDVLTFKVSLPELIAQTNMDHQSVNRLREELSKMTNWLGRNATNYFVSEYETPSPDYIEKARAL